MGGHSQGHSEPAARTAPRSTSCSTPPAHWSRCRRGPPCSAAARRPGRAGLQAGRAGLQAGRAGLQAGRAGLQAGREDLLLDRSSAQHAVDVHALLLSIPPHARRRLLVVGGVPVRVEEDEPVGADQVEAAAARLGGEHGYMCGCSLECMRLQPRLLRVAASDAWAGGLQPPALDESRKTKRFAFGSLISSTILVRFLIEHEPSSLQHGHRSNSHMRSKRLSVCVAGRCRALQGVAGVRPSCGGDD